MLFTCCQLQNECSENREQRFLKNLIESSSDGAEDVRHVLLYMLHVDLSFTISFFFKSMDQVRHTLIILIKGQI